MLRAILFILIIAVLVVIAGIATVRISCLAHAARTLR